MQLPSSWKTWLAAAALAAIAGTAALPARAQGTSLIDDIKQRGVLRVGLATFVPWAMRDKNGDVVGFEVDVSKKLAEDMGVKAEIIPTAWAGIIPALIAKKFDVIIGGLSITPARNLTINFTAPYAHSGQQMAANKQLAGGFKGLDGFNSPDVTIACRRGTTTCAIANQFFPKAKTRQFDDDAQAFQEVVNGNAYAVISSAPKPKFWTLDFPDKLFMPTEANLTSSDEGFGLRKGDPDALNFFNNWILYHTTDGWLTERHDFWFKGQTWKDSIAKDQ